MKKSELTKEIMKTKESTDNIGVLEKEKNEIISKMNGLEKNYFSGNLLDEEYDELKKPLDEKVKKIDQELKRLSGIDSEGITSTSINNEDQKEAKSNIWSIIILFLITGIVGAFLFVLIGYIVSIVIKFVFPKTKRVEFNNVDFANYGWRGVAVLIIGIIFFMIFSWFWLIFSGEPIDNDIKSNIIRVAIIGVLLIFGYAGIKQFEPSEKI